jgi:hypothetical protein
MRWATRIIINDETTQDTDDARDEQGRSAVANRRMR